MNLFFVFLLQILHASRSTNAAATLGIRPTMNPSHAFPGFPPGTFPGIPGATPPFHPPLPQVTGIPHLVAKVLS